MNYPTIRLPYSLIFRQIPSPPNWAAHGVTDGTRTHNSRNHSPAPYQLGDGHIRLLAWRAKIMGGAGTS